MRRFSFITGFNFEPARYCQDGILSVSLLLQSIMYFHRRDRTCPVQVNITRVTTAGIFINHFFPKRNLPGELQGGFFLGRETRLLIQANDVRNHVCNLLRCQRSIIPPGRHASGRLAALRHGTVFQEQVKIIGKCLVIRIDQRRIDGV
jgi:hypothetical protein